MSISAKAMAITGIEDRRYWNWIPTEESRLDINLFYKLVDFLIEFIFTMFYQDYLLLGD